LAEEEAHLLAEHGSWRHHTYAEIDARIEKGVDGLIALRTEQRQIVFDLISIVTRVAKRHDEPPAMDGLVDTDYGPMWMKIDLKPLTQVGKSAPSKNRSKAESCP
jgi:hypothetical protein